ncbi:hypothetical protein B0T22DRAFT_457512 [Podospora appendiculata]|uniref:Cyclin-like domain-containing protein n=1 Tax=Podospora appendiculata TaxID=314037 RepID=A0AAE0X7L4_9PEZI|nr:hypothetical protein B0T22DRAFT_457512 [Podospora appendiculata]
MSPAVKLPGLAIPSKTNAKPKKPNAVRRIMNREESRERRVRETSVAAASTANTPAASAKLSKRLNCANKACKKPNVVDGTCQTCGRVADDSNIVSEITFGESSNGAATVQGSYLAADQGGVRSVGGQAFRRVAGGGASEARERSLREIKGLLAQYAQQLRITPTLSDTAYRFYRMASNDGFVQGRRKTNVAAICLYAACRKEDSNKIMLIDLADLVKTDVFLLGRGYKEFLSHFPDMREGTKPIIMEDLIFRFASKLEFFHDTNKVAESAVRIAARMRHDNITHGRRPAGICGAAIIMAARAHNYRRTVREVVFIAKVTMTTLQERMEEFANVPSAQMTISEFNDQPYRSREAGFSWRETSEFDPPFVYKQTQEWKDGHTRPRKRKAQEMSTADSPSASDGTQAVPPSAGAPLENGAIITPAPFASPAPPPIIDKDGFVVPPLPQRASQPTPEAADEPNSEMDDISMIATATVRVDEQLETLASEFGDSESEDELDPSSEMAMAAAQGIEIPGSVASRRQGGANGKGKGASKSGRKKKKGVQMPINAEWEMDEANLEQEMEGHLKDPALLGASAVVAKHVEEKRAQEAETEDTETPLADVTNSTTQNTQQDDPDVPLDPRLTPRSKVSDDPIVHEDEFADDPEVLYCRLGEEEAKIKEMIWANHNKDYMRAVQQKIFNSKIEANGPPKQHRNRAKKARIGEGQASPAGSAEEAAINMMRTRAISTKLDYSKLGQVFDLSTRGPGSTPSHSVLASDAGSDAGSDEENVSPAKDVDPPTPAPEPAKPTPEPAEPAPAQPATAERAISPSPSIVEEVADDDYDGESAMYGAENGYEDDTFVEEDINPFADDDGYGDGADEDDEY